jgi:uncharacterized paraquat-inducible protein A
VPRKDDWIQCPDCEEEFNVISSVSNRVEYCPYCGSDIEWEIDEDLDEDDLDV